MTDKQPFEISLKYMRSILLYLDRIRIFSKEINEHSYMWSRPHKMKLKKKLSLKKGVSKKQPSQNWWPLIMAINFRYSCLAPDVVVIPPLFLFYSVMLKKREEYFLYAQVICQILWCWDDNGIQFGYCVKSRSQNSRCQRCVLCRCLLRSMGSSFPLRKATS